MNIISFELSKIWNRRLSLILLISTVVLLPLIVSVVSHLDATNDEFARDKFLLQVAYGIIAYSQSYFFLPIWIIVFVGVELSNGHANRVTFTKSRKFYVLSKFAYCALITVLFCILGLLSFVIAVNTSPLKGLNVSIGYYFEFLLQMVFATFAYSILLLTLVFVFRSPLVTFIIYFGWSFVEGIAFTVFEKLYDIELRWMPLHLMRTIYCDNGDVVSAHYRLLNESVGTLWLPLGLVCVLMLFIYRWFCYTDLKVLSD